MPDLLYDLSAGFDNTGLVNLQIDTFERMNRLEAGLNIPKLQGISVPEYKSFVPKDIDGDTILTKKSIDLPDIKDGLLSADPKIRQAAKQAMAIQAQANPVSRGVGTKQVVPYTEGQNKFTNDNILKGKRSTMFGYNPYKSLDENENFYHENVWNSYSTLGKAWRGAGIFTGRVLSKAVTGLVGMVGDVGSMAWNGLQELGEVAGGPKNNFWNDVSNNALAREMEKWDNHVKEQWLPTYKALNYDNKGAWEKLIDPYTWTNSFADGAGFLLQFVVPGAMFGKLGNAGRLARSIGTLKEELLIAKTAGDTTKAAQLSKTISQVKSVSGFTKAMGYDIQSKFGAGLARTLTGSDNIGGISAHVFNTMLESVAETKEGFNSTVEELVSKGISKEEAIKIAGENAPGQFWINTAILSMSNAFENKLLQKALSNRATTISNKLDDGTLIPTPTSSTTTVGKFFQNNAWGNRINFYGKNAAKSSFFEGFWEENAQTAAARWAAGGYERKGDDVGSREKSAKTWLGQLWNQTQDAIKGNDREAADSIMAGSVIGILGNTVFSKLASTRGEIRDADGNVVKPKTFLPEGQRKAEKRENAQRVAKFINTRDAWLGIKTFGDDVRNADGTENPDLVKSKIDEIKEKVNKVNQFAAKNVTAQNITDPIKREQLQTQLFADYVKAHILNDTADSLVARLQEWKNKSSEELALYGVTDELTEQAPKWAQKAQELVDYYKEIKDIKYTAPAATTLTEYQNTTAAIHSLIYDYTAQRDMHQEISDQEDIVANENNPFSDYTLVQDYNQDHIKLLKLQQKLSKENLDVIEREKIQKQIDDIEKKQKERKDTFSTLNNTITLPDGLILPKDIDKAKESARISKFESYFKAINNKVDHEITAQKYDDIIEMYSNPETGYSAFENQSEYFDNLYNKDADTKVDTDVVNQTIKTREKLLKDKEELKSQLIDAKTKIERDALKDKIRAINTALSIIDEDLDTTDLPDNPPPPPPDEVQYGVDDYSDQALAIDTPFKTANKETIDSRDEVTKERIWWKEIALEHGYDHDLTQFARQYLTELQTAPDKYEMFIIKDTMDLMKQRLSKNQLQDFDEGKFTAGAIVVFREKGKTEYSKFKSGKIIAFSFNKDAFNYNYDERVVANSRKTKREIPEVIAYFEQQQQILEAAREKAIIENAIIPIKSQSGALGLFPSTTPDLAINRFSNFINNNDLFTIIKPDNKNNIPNAKEGQVYLNIPESKTVNEKKFYIPVFGSAIQKTEGESIQNKIYDSIQGIQYTTFKTKKEASDIVRNYLFNFFYLSAENNFIFKPVVGGFKIVYFDEKGEHPNWLLKPKVKLNDKLYNTEVGFFLYERVTDTFQPTTKITKDQYRNFIHNHLLTRRKVIVQHVKNKGERLYIQPVNAYLNLAVINEDDIKTGNAIQTTAQALIQSDQKSESESLLSKEQKAIDAFQGKTFTKLKSWTDLLQDSNKTLEDKKQALREISDQMLAPSTAETTSDELGKELVNLIDALGYPAPIENQELTQATAVNTLPIQQQIANIEESLKIQTAPSVVKFLEASLEKLKQQLPKPKENMTTLEKLRATINEEAETNSGSLIIPYTFDGNILKISFDNDSIDDLPPNIDDKYAQDFYATFPTNVYTKSTVKINNKDYYFVKHSQSGKFVTFDSNMKVYKISELPQEVTERSEFKNIENCN
jgi:hypothetical protein